MEKINIAELLKDCPKGMELDCTMFDNVVLYGVNGSSYPISILAGGRKKSRLNLTKTGCCNNNPDAKCVIFPKGKTTWEGFKRPFKDGDILYIYSANPWICIYKEGGEKDNVYYKHVAITSSSFVYDCSPLCHRNNVTEIRHATEEEKQKLFDVIKDNGYKWNTETKTLEELVEPKFKVGDKIKSKENHNYIYTITGIREKENKYECGVTFVLRFSEQDNWELVPNKFDITTLKPFDSRVLVRHNRDNKWCASFFSHIDEDFHSHCYKFVTTSGRSYPMCIPYEGNEHLLGKADDCDEYFEIWK